MELLLPLKKEQSHRVRIYVGVTIELTDLNLKPLFTKFSELFYFMRNTMPVNFDPVKKINAVSV